MTLQRYVYSVATLLFFTSIALADRVELNDGKVLDPCYVLDEGTRLLVWDSIALVGGPPQQTILRSNVKSVKVIRDDSWDVKPNLPDLSVTYIEMTPKLAGLHGRIKYGEPWIMKPAGAAEILDTGDDGYLNPEATVKNLKLKYTPGEVITLTAHVKNLGFSATKSFNYVWLIDGKEVQKGTYSKSLKEMGETSFEYKYHWGPLKPTATFRVITDQPEISKNNNEVVDPLWGFSYIYIVSNGRINAWHQARTAFGTFSFEDYYRWHVDLMNKLFADSVFPSSPNGIGARVRLDKIVYTDNVDKTQATRMNEGHLIMDQGGWVWTDNADEQKSGKWSPPDREGRTQTEWSLPHELGHQLGLIDWYAHDNDGTVDHLWPDNGEKVAHFQNHPQSMMHWHGPQVYNEVDAAFLNMTWDKPRGHFGDYVFAIPSENLLRIVDVNGQNVSGAKVEIYQRGVVVDPKGKPQVDRGITWYPILMDGNYDRGEGKLPVIVGNTDANGVLRLPNRAVREVKTLNGFHLKPNPFGPLNCFQPSLMLVKVTKNERQSYFWLEIYDFNTGWFRGQKDRFELTLKTPYGSASSPKPPLEVSVTKIDATHVKVTWKRPVQDDKEQTYLKRPIGYRVYRRVGPMGLNDRPWFVVGSANPDTFECVVDLTQYPIDVEWFAKTNRFAVSTVGENSIESELIEVVLK